MISHEDISKQVFSKNYIPFFLKLIISITIFFFEKFISLFIILLFSTTNSIAKNFRFIDSKVYVINNYPLFERIEE